MTEKNNKILKTIIAIGSTILFIGIAWGILSTEQKHTNKRVEEIRTESINKDKLHDIQIHQIEIQNARTEQRLISIDEGVKRIEEKLPK